MKSKKFNQSIKRELEIISASFNNTLLARWLQHSLNSFMYIHTEIHIYEKNTRALVLVEGRATASHCLYTPCNGTYMSTPVEGNHMRTPVIGGHRCNGRHMRHPRHPRRPHHARVKLLISLSRLAEGWPREGRFPLHQVRRSPPALTPSLICGTACACPCGPASSHDFPLSCHSSPSSLSYPSYPWRSPSGPSCSLFKDLYSVSEPVNSTSSPLEAHGYLYMLAYTYAWPAG